MTALPRKRTLCFATAASIAASLVAVNRAHAHPEFNPVSTNRYVKLNLVSPTSVRLAYTVMYGAAPAAAMRQQADTNRDGTLDESESRSLGTRLQAAVAAGLELTVDGKRVQPVFETPQVGLAGAEVGPSAFSVDLIARIDGLSAGAHELRLDDHTELASLGETEVRIEEAPATQLVSSFRGAPTPGVTERETKFLFRGDKRSALEDRSVTLRFAPASASPSTTAVAVKPRSRAPWLYGAGLAVLLTMIGVGLRRRARAQR